MVVPGLPVTCNPFSRRVISSKYTHSALQSKLYHVIPGVGNTGAFDIERS
jgi:hypothetical protein